MLKNYALVIEDDEDLSSIFTKALQTSGFEVEAILDGQAAEQRLKEIVPSVIVLLRPLPRDQARDRGPRRGPSPRAGRAARSEVRPLRVPQEPREHDGLAVRHVRPPQ